MILSGRDIQWYMETAKLKIRPCDSIQFQQNGVDLILDDVDWGDRYVGPVPIFMLGTTKEYIEMPDDLMAFVGLRSTWAREGYSMNGLTVVDAGFKGTLTLEIVAFKPYNRPPIGERFVHLVFAKLTSPSEPYKGKYQGQRGITKAIHGTR